MKQDAERLLAVFNERLAKLRTQEKREINSTRCFSDDLRSNCLVNDRKSNTFPRTGHSKKCGFRQRKLSLTLEHEKGVLQDYSNSPTQKAPIGQKIKTYFEVDFEDSSWEDEFDIEELKKILLSFSLEKENSIENDGCLTTTLCSTEL